MPELGVLPLLEGARTLSWHASDPRPLRGLPPSGIEVVSQTVAPPTPNQDGASQNTKTQLGVIP